MSETPKAKRPWRVVGGLNGPFFAPGQESQNTHLRALMFIETPDGALGQTLCNLRMEPTPLRDVAESSQKLTCDMPTLVRLIGAGRRCQLSSG